MIPYGRQDVSRADIEAVLAVLKSDFLTQGPAVGDFERKVAGRVGAAHAVAVSSATAGLHIACGALGLGPGDVLWTVPNTFVASANCARYCGADVDFVDIDAETWNISVPALELKLTNARAAGKLPKALVSVHFAGQPPEQEKIKALSMKYGFRIIEDASHAIGASRNSEPVGSCRWSDMTVFSFHPVKIITTAEGGMVLTQDQGLAQSLGDLRNHGITRDASRFVGESPGPWYYEQQSLGFNYRLTDIQAALGASQLSRIDEFVERRNELAAWYSRELKDLPLHLPTVLPGNTSAFHLYVVRLAGIPGRARHREVFESLRARGIGVNLHYLPVHLQPYYRELGFGPGDFPESERYADEALSLPMFPSLGDAQRRQVVDSMRAILN